VIILVDTSIWSLVLRRRSAALGPLERALAAELGELIREGRTRLIGPIRQELLSGVRDHNQYERLRDHLRAFPDEPLATADYEAAAQVSNTCRSVGIAGSPVDFLICAVALGRGWPIFTTDQDFRQYAKVVAIKIHETR
jgi:hypothetical protein